jgi:hypothetical protein
LVIKFLAEVPRTAYSAALRARLGEKLLLNRVHMLSRRRACGAKTTARLVLQSTFAASFTQVAIAPPYHELVYASIEKRRPRAYTCAKPPSTNSSAPVM